MKEEEEKREENIYIIENLLFLKIKSFILI